MKTSDLPKRFRGGQELTSDLVDAILRELWRWRSLQSSSGILIDNANSDQPPHFSLGYTPPTNLAWGVTPASGGPSAPYAYGGGSFASPYQNSVSVSLYPFPDSSDTTEQITATSTYSVYTANIAINKKALYQMAPDGKWYIVTADC